ncbi:phenylacetate--CoA ligase family protein [Candidatus Poribacteria bacterium]|nr:phenylacetate--CoA ligase family protein [Candidatus Poribacteria bacterium]
MSITRSAKKIISTAAWSAYNFYRLGKYFKSDYHDVSELFNAQRPRIRHHQVDSLRVLINFSKESTPYYTNLLEGIDIDLYEHITDEEIDLSFLPPLEKHQIRNHLDELCSTRFKTKERIKNATGGSTGTPLTFYQSRGYWNYRNLSVYYFDRWAGWDFGEPQLVIWGSQVDMKNGGKWIKNLNWYWRNQYWLNGFHLTESEMYNTYQRMQKFQPTTILAYPSSLYQFALFLSENNLNPNWNLNGIISSAEMLHSHYRSIAETVFQTKVYNRYGSREVGLIAMECDEGRMHINCSDMYLEIDSPDPYNQPGDILITQFNNYIMPFIRYRIGDIGRLSDEKCPCGNELPILAELWGRSTATFRTKEGKLIHGGYFTQKFYNLKGVSQFQLIQETLDQCSIKIIKDKEWNEDERLFIDSVIKECLGSDVSLSMEFVNEIPLPKSGKREFTISRVT